MEGTSEVGAKCGLLLFCPELQMPHSQSDAMEPMFEYDPTSYLGSDEAICYPNPTYEEFLHCWCGFSCPGNADHDPFGGAPESNELTRILSRKGEQWMSEDDYFHCLKAGSWIFNGNGGRGDGSIYELEKTEKVYTDEEQLACQSSDENLGYQSCYDHASWAGNGLGSKYMEEIEHDYTQDGTRLICSYIMDESGLCQWLFGYPPCPTSDFQESHGEVDAGERSYGYEVGQEQQLPWRENQGLELATAE